MTLICTIVKIKVNRKKNKNVRTMKKKSQILSSHEDSYCNQLILTKVSLIRDLHQFVIQFQNRYLYKNNIKYLGSFIRARTCFSILIQTHF